MLGWASGHGLSRRIPYLNGLENVQAYRRRILLGYGFQNFFGKNSLENYAMFIGQCLVKKHEEDLDCPITLEDAIETYNAADLANALNLPVVSFFPDAEYSRFLDKRLKRSLECITEKFCKFKSRIMPNAVQVRTSEYEKELLELEKRFEDLAFFVKRAYGRSFTTSIHFRTSPHKMQKVVLRYAIDELWLPERLLEKHNVLVVASPEESCSVEAAQMLIQRAGMEKLISQLATLPVPSLDLREQRMFDAKRDQRIHLNEEPSTIRRKLNSTMASAILYISPLTKEKQVEDLLYSSEESVEILIEQIGMMAKNLY
jgi:hypothetical protein